MAVDDLWYLKKRDPETGKAVPSKRHGRGKRWRVRYTDPETGRKVEELFEKKSDAEREDANQRADISRGRWIDPRAGQVKIREYAEAWRAQQLHRDSTADKVEIAFRIHVNPIIGDVPIGAARSSHMRNWVKDRVANGGLAASTIHLIFGYVAQMFATAVHDRLIGESPCPGVQLPEIDHGDRFIPTPEQVHAVALALPDRYRAVPYLAAGCGLRGGEIMGLELPHVEFLRREVRVAQQLGYKTGRGRYIGPVKTKTSKRTVELPDVVSTALARHLEQFPPLAMVLEDESGRSTVERRTQLLFSTSAGQPVLRSSWSGVWQVAVRKAGLPEGFGLHGLRHYFATLLIHSGASVKTVQLALGHSTPAITLSTYIHEWPDSIDRTRTLINDALGTELPAQLEQAQ